MQERRASPRMLCADMLEVRWIQDTGQTGQATALLEDISASGACLQTEHPIPVGAEICWASPLQWFAGLVRHCSYREVGYFIGIEFLPGCRWSEEEFRPQHLLNVEELVERTRKAQE